MTGFSILPQIGVSCSSCPPPLLGFFWRCRKRKMTTVMCAHAGDKQHECRADLSRSCRIAIYQDHILKRLAVVRVVLVTEKVVITVKQVTQTQHKDQHLNKFSKLFITDSSILASSAAEFCRTDSEK